MVAGGNRIFLATPEQGPRRDGRLKTGTYDARQPDNARWEEDDLQLTPNGFAYSTMALHDVVYEADQYASLEYVQVHLD